MLLSATALGITIAGIVVYRKVVAPLDRMLQLSEDLCGRVSSRSTTAHTWQLRNSQDLENLVRAVGSIQCAVPPATAAMDEQEKLTGQRRVE